MKFSDVILLSFAMRI